MVIYYLQADALIWRFQICVCYPISMHSILHNIEWHCPTNYLLLLFSTLYFAILIIFYVLKVESQITMP